MIALKFSKNIFKAVAKGPQKALYSHNKQAVLFEIEYKKLTISLQAQVPRQRKNPGRKSRQRIEAAAKAREKTANPTLESAQNKFKRWQRTLCKIHSF